MLDGLMRGGSVRPAVGRQLVEPGAILGKALILCVMMQEPPDKVGGQIAVLGISRWSRGDAHRLRISLQVINARLPWHGQATGGTFRIGCRQVDGAVPVILHDLVVRIPVDGLMEWLSLRGRLGLGRFRSRGIGR